MQLRFTLLLFAIFGVLSVKANNIGDEGNASTCKEATCKEKDKKDEINGQVFNSGSKRPIRDVSITAYSLPDKKESVAQTDGAGNYYFDELKPGTYRFVFEKTGFKKIVKDRVVIKTDEAFQMNIEMIENSSVDIMPSPLHF